MMAEDKINLELIIHRLDTIAENQDNFSERLGNIEKQLNAIETHGYEIKSLKDWKTTVEAVASPSELKEVMAWKHQISEIVSASQLKDKIKDVEDLKTFKTQALMIWLIVQTLSAIALFAIKFIK